VSLSNQIISFGQRLKNIFIGQSRDISDNTTFHKISLVAVLAWIGLGSDGISSSCYGPEEAFRNLAGHPALAIFVGLATAFTIFIISSSYMQIIQLFPHGGGGYIVASKLLSPTVGMISGSALLIDYLLTITLSISSGADAIFSFLPLEWQAYKLMTALTALILLIILNLRGAKESVLSLTPIFAVFILTHVFVVIYIFASQSGNIAAISHSTAIDIHKSVNQLGMFGAIFLVLRAYSMGAGTFTGIEAVSNGMPILREPKIRTAKRTMRLMAVSLSFIVLGLMLAYSLYNVRFQEGKTLNAVLFERMTAHWSAGFSYSFVLITLISEAALLFVAAQTGFLDGPRIMANMAVDNWLPRRFASLSDRLVTQNGVLLMGAAAIVLLLVSKGSVSFLIILYSINVFITFSLSQLGMVRHWWSVKKEEKGWIHKIIINGIGLVLTTFILFSVTIVKFTEGGWVTIVITGLLVLVALLIKKHYYHIAVRLQKLQFDITSELQPRIAKLAALNEVKESQIVKNNNAKTAIILVSGYNGTGIHALLKVIESFNGLYKNFIFVQIGLVDAKTFKGSDQIDKLRSQVDEDLQKYIDIVNSLGYYGQSFWTVGTDIVLALEEIVPDIMKEFPDSTFFGGQLIFSQAYFLSKILHNHTIFEVQRKLYKRGITTVILPINID